MLPQNMASWPTEFFKLKQLEKWQVKERFSDHSFSPEVVPKTLACELLSLYSEGRSILPTKDEGLPKGIQRNRQWCS